MFTQLLLAFYQIPVAFAALPPAQGQAGFPPAQGQAGGGFELYDPLGCSGDKNGGLVCVLHNILSALRIIAVPIVSIMVIVGAFQILTAGGDEEKIKTGRHTITWAVVGFAIIFLAENVAGIIQSVIGK